MKPLLRLKDALIRGCVVYTILITAVYFLGASVNSRFLPTPQAVLGILIFSFYLSLSGLFLFSDLLVPALRVVLHFAVTALVFYLAFLRFGGYLKNGGSAFVGLLVFALIYAICAAVVFLIRHLTTEKKQEEKEYGSMFGGKS